MRFAMRVGVLLATIPLLAASPPPRVLIHTASGSEVSVTVEIASTPAQRQRGLMFRRGLEPMHGMLFVFQDNADHPFWMKNTPLSLDIVFIDASRHVVGIQANTVPYSERRLRAGRSSRYVLELAAGFCVREGVQVGDSVEFRGIESAVAEGEGRADDSDRVSGPRSPSETSLGH